MRILLLGLNYDPEPVGIGPYSGGLARWLAARGHAVRAIAALPYYPDWRLAPGERLRYRRSREQGVDVLRCPLYVPRRPSGLRRIAHHLSFLAAATPPALAAARRFRPELVVTVAPSLATVPLARVTTWAAGARSWLHIQDFEVEAALATGLLPAGGGAARIARRVEQAAMRGFDRYSSISPQMCRRLVERGVAPDRVVELRNWSELDTIVPQAGSTLRAAWRVATPHVALYSGNIANKQGLEIVVAAAHLLRGRRDLSFVICGEGPTLGALKAAAADLPAVQFRPLQPREALSDLLALATVHLLPQLAGAADLVLPSKLTNMLASGRPTVATAAPGTGIALELEGCGLIVPPGDAAAFAAAIERLIDDPALCATLGAAARARAEERCGRDAILTRAEAEMRAIVGGGRGRAAAR